VVKLDVGTHVDGYIADTAVTIELGTNQYNAMIQAAQDALAAAIDVMKADIALSTVGSAIEKTIVSHGFKSIDNLTGHSLGQYALHSGMSIPNVSDWYRKDKPQVGDVVAIEPFATNGAGHVVSGPGSNIYIYNDSVGFRFIRDQRMRGIVHQIKSRFHGLPFAERWCVDEIPGCERVLHRLTLLKPLKHYPQLIDAKKGVVTQAEHTVIVCEDGCEVTT
jgi:methionyl aminopeptidase